MGVANDRSIAWGIAKEAYLNGAELAFTFQNDMFFERIQKLALSVNSDKIIKCNVEKKDEVCSVFRILKDHWGSLDFIVHAIAFSEKDELKGRYSDTSRENFLKTMLISSFSLTEICNEALPLMKGTVNGGSIITLSYFGGERTTPNYNVMGVAKASLEASVKYLSVDLGNDNIRVNSLSAGPMRTLAGSAISGARHVFRYSERNSPLGRNPSLSDVGKAGVYLLSNLSSGVTGENHYVDSGFNIVAVPKDI